MQHGYFCTTPRICAAQHIPNKICSIPEIDYRRGCSYQQLIVYNTDYPFWQSPCMGYVSRKVCFYWRNKLTTVWSTCCDTLLTVKNPAVAPELVASFANWSNGLYRLKITDSQDDLSHLQTRPLHHAHTGKETRNDADSCPTFSNRVQRIYLATPFHAAAWSQV